MSNVLSNSRKSMIEWFEARIAAWQADPDSIGLNLSQVSSLFQLIQTARQMMNEQEAAYVDARAATSAFHSAADLLRKEGGNYIKIVRAFAENQTDPGEVFKAAKIPVPETPSEQGAPPMAARVDLTLDTSGAVNIAWRAPSGGFGQGAFFVVERKLDGDSSPWEKIATTGERKYQDTTVPKGFSDVSYRILSGRGGEYSSPTLPVNLIAGSGTVATNAMSNNASDGGSPMAEAA